MTSPPTGLARTGNTSAPPFRVSIALALAAVASLLSGQTSQTAIFRVQPLRPVEELRQEALRAAPPIEKGEFLAPDLVDLATLNAGFHYDIRYATKNNFLSTPFYSEPRAFLERPAARALALAAADLSAHGFGILIHDGYRPWYVTKMFWDATPDNLHTFVANPAKGSKHNRGCAIDLSLYDLRTGMPVEMPSGYDEMTERAHPYYKGGSRQATQRRDLLRHIMETHGFTVDAGEWWHFDYRDWPRYPIINTRFELLPKNQASQD